MQSQFRSVPQSQYYCWVGILLACMAILLAGSLGPKRAYYRAPDTVLEKSNYSIQQAAMTHPSPQVAQR
jgi:hypothetical protein